MYCCKNHIYLHKNKLYNKYVQNISHTLASLLSFQLHSQGNPIYTFSEIVSKTLELRMIDLSFSQSKLPIGFTITLASACGLL